jgi:hypothetical protein
MKVGSLIECIDNSAPLRGWCCIPPIKGTIYTVRAIFRALDPEGDFGYAITTEEVKNTCNMYGNEWGWSIERFREIQPPLKISLKDLLEEPVLA